MKKIIFSLIVCTGLLLCAITATMADSVTFTVSATVPAATGVSIAASRVTSTSPPVFSTVSGTSLSFDPLTFDPTNKIWLPDHYFAIDVGTTGGGGTPDTTVTYTEGTNPNSPGHGLGWKSTATFMKVVGTTESLTPNGKKMLKDLSSEHILPASVSGGYLRIYVGVVAKDPAAVPLDPATSEPFTNTDKAGTYNGSLLITATAV